MSISGFFKSIFGGGKSETSKAKEAPVASVSEAPPVADPVSISSQPEGTLEEIPVTFDEDVPTADGADEALVSDEEYFDEDLMEFPHFETLEVFGGIGGYVGPILTKDRVGLKGTRRGGTLGKTRNSVAPRAQHGGAPTPRKSRGGAPTDRRGRGGAPNSER